MVGLAMAQNLTPLRISPLRFFMLLALPYLLVVLIAYVGARVVYNLGTELKRNIREAWWYDMVSGHNAIGKLPDAPSPFGMVGVVVNSAVFLTAGTLPVTSLVMSLPAALVGGLFSNGH